VKGRASGKHYSFDGRLPFVPGIDGTGILPGGERVYFAFPVAPWGSMAQRAPVALNHCLPLPDALDDITAAAMANPGMSAWAALVKRAGMKAGETVLINGATGSAGQLAVQIARFLGARKVIACGRNVEKLAALGADETVNLSQDEADLRTQFAGLAAQQIDVVVDYLWGRSAELLLPALAKHSPGNAPVRFIQVGSLSAADISQWRGAALLAAAADGQRNWQPFCAPAAGRHRGNAAGRRRRRVDYRHDSPAASRGRHGVAAGRQPETHRLCRRLKKSLLHKSWG
jgi:hypothetical protein